MTLLYLVAAWAAGIFLASLAPQSSPGAWIVLAAGSLLLAVFVRRRCGWRIALLCLTLLALGAARYDRATRPPTAHHIARQTNSGWVSVTGVITRDPDVRDDHVKLRIQTETLAREGQASPVEGLLLAEVPRYGEYAYGDRVTVSGSLLIPPEFDDFSYRDYLARRGIHAWMPDAQIKIVAHDQGQAWAALLYDLKARAQQTIDRLLPSPQAPLLSGILLGTESSIPADVRDAFNRTGTSHIIAISGANIVIVMGALIRLFRPALARRSSWIALGGVAVYAMFVGGDPAVVRAAIMAGLALWAMQLGRRAHGITTLAFTVWLMTLWNPLTLWEVGFLLSVAATAGLVLFADDIARLIERLLRKGFRDTTARSMARRLADPLAVSLAAQITTTPLILVYFGRLSPVALLANLLIVPAQTYVMLLGWIVVLLGLIWLPVGEVAAWVAWLPLTYTLAVVRGLARLDWASIPFRLSTTYAWIIYAGLLALALLKFQHREDRAALFRLVRQRFTVYTVAVAGIILSLLVWVVAFSQPDGKLHVWFLDVGHGHAVLIQTPHGSQILVDGGPNPSRLRRAVGDALPFWDRHLDLVIVTQPKDSAMGALPALLEHYDISLAASSGQTSNDESYRALSRAWNDRGVRVISLIAGSHIETGDGVLLEVLHPQTLPAPEDDVKSVGMVLRVSYGDTSFLLTPDLDDKAGHTLLAAGWYAGSTVLELPSYGDAGASPPEFLQAVHPQAVVVSVGAGNRARLPDAELIGQLDNRPLYRTDEQGTIEMVTDGRRLWVFTER